VNWFALFNDAVSETHVLQGDPKPNTPLEKGLMNHVYRLVWSHSRNGWVAVSEIARGRKKGSGRRLTLAALSLTAAVAQAGPSGGQVVSGNGQISSSGNTTTVTQSSQNLSLNWQTFNVAPQETVDFVQPSASAVAVNHILGNSGSQILGHLNANGQVYLINPNGILFGAASQVDVGGLVASTLEANATNSAGNTRSFSGSGTGSVVNEGTITAANGGYVVLLGNRVSNVGTIVAQLGTVGFGAGSAVTLTFSGDSLVGMQVDRSTLNNLAANGGLIQADGGRVIMTAGARNALLASVVNNTGVIEARTVEDHDGTITLLGGMTAGQVNVGGTLDASAPNGGNGGAIETSAAHVSVADNTVVTTAAAKGLTGSWTVDPQDFTVAASGGDITGSTLSGELATTNVQLESSSGATAGSGNVNVNDPVTWTANTTLTLTASNNVNINANIAATGATAGLVIAPNTANGAEVASGTGVYTLNNGSSITLSGATPSLSIAGQPYTVINSLGAAGSATGTDLQGINGNPAGNYALGSNIDASPTSSWNSGAGFQPIASFSGVFDGLGHTVNNLVINLPATNLVGFFANSSGTIQNVGLTGASVTGGPSWTGGLVGNNSGMISNSYVTGSVSAATYTGGLVGASSGSITNSYSTATVAGADRVGGLVGLNGGTITDSYATGAVSAAGTVGGLVGYNYGTVSGSYATGVVTAATNSFAVGGLVGSNYNMVTNSYATGAVNGASGSTDVGGLVGYNYGQTGATVSNSYATGAVSGATNVGGLVGYNFAGPFATSATVTNSYATGSVTGLANAFDVGGLVGYNYGQTPSGPSTPTATVSNSYSTGAVSAGTGAAHVGGLVGNNAANSGATATVTDSYWDQTASGQTTSAGGTPLTTAQMLQQASFTGLDFTNTWVMYEGLTNPLLRGFMTPLTVTANDATETYSGLAYSGGNGVTYSVTPSGNLLGSLTYGGTSQGAINAASYTLTPQGLYSNQQGYLITFVGGTLTVSPADLQITANNGSVIYGQATPTLGASYSGFVNNETAANLTTPPTLSTTAVTGSNVGSYAIVPSGAVDPNYTITYVNGSLSVTPATLTVNGTSAANKVYDGTTTASLSGGTLSGVYGSDAVTLTQAGAFASQNVGTGIAVTAADTLTGTAAGNYTLTQPTGLSANITPASLTVTGTSVANKVYDGTTAATLSSGTLSGVYGSDAVTLTQAGAFASANAGTGVAVNASDSLGGTSAGNYTLTQPAGLTANITPASLTVGGTSVANKVYDGTTAATLSGGTLSGVIGSDSVSLTQSGAFASANAGTGVAVNASDSLGGTAAGNYTITQPTGLTANITPASLTVSGTSAVNKIYDGTTAATLSGGTLSGIIGSDSVTLTQAGNFASANAGTGIAVTGADALGGTAAGNYTLTQPTGLNANITPASLTVGGTSVANKVYDGTTAAMLSGGTLSGVVGSDSVSLTQAGAFTSANAGTGIAVNASDTLSGAGAGNYTLTQPTGLTGNITPASLTVSGTSVANKVYDGTTAASLSGGTLSGLIGSDSVSLTQAGAFTSPNAGTGVAVNASDTLSGVSASNYTIAQPTGLTANITPATLTYVALPDSTTAGKPASGLSGAVNGFVTGDTLVNSTSGTELWTTNATVASAPGSYAIDGGGLTSGNYVFTQAAGNATALTVGPAITPPPAVAFTTPSSVAWLESTVLGDSGNGTSATFNPPNIWGGFSQTSESTTDLGGGKLYIENGGVRLPDSPPGAH
jgi:filamentous hemagglutinin family protein